MSWLSWLDRTIRSNLHHRSGIIHRFVMSMPSYTVNQLLQFTTVYRRWYVIYTRPFICHGRPSLAVENRIYCLKGNYLLHIIHMCTKNLPVIHNYFTLPSIPTCIWRSVNKGAKGIYNIEWVLRWWFSAYNCEPNNISLCTMQFTNENKRYFLLAAHNNLPHLSGGKIAIYKQAYIMLSGH